MWYEVGVMGVISYLRTIAGTLWSVFEWKCLQESEEALNQENHSISDLHQVLAREINLPFLFLFPIHFHLRITATAIIISRDRLHPIYSTKGHFNNNIL